LRPQETIPLSFRNSHTVFHCCTANFSCSHFVILFILVSILFAHWFGFDHNETFFMLLPTSITFLAHHTTKGTAIGKAPHTVAQNATFLADVSPCCATSNIACSAPPTKAPCATPFATVGRLRAASHALAVWNAQAPAFVNHKGHDAIMELASGTTALDSCVAVASGSAHIAHSVISLI
jgi:hypothetical protein